MAKIAFFTLNAYDMLADSDGTQVGGAQLQQILVGKELARRGHETYFIEYDTGHKSEITVDGIQIILKPEPTGSELKRALTAVRGTWQVLTDIKPDVCYRRALDFEIIVLSMLCRIVGVRFVYGIAHDSNLSDNPHMFKDGLKSTRPYRWLNRQAISRATAVIAQNQFQYNEATRLLQAPVYQIPNCYEPNSLPPLAALADESDLVVLWVARFTNFKRPRIVLDIAEQLPEITFVMVGGPGDKELYNSIRSQAETFDNVRFEGFVPFSEIDRYFSSADLFLNTSEQEGFPNTFLQAWAYRKPVISLTVDPNEVLSTYDAGWVLNDSVEDTVSLLAELATDRDRIQTVGEQAVHYFEANHSVENIVDKYESVFVS